MNNAALPVAELPDSWTWCALGDLGSWCGGGTPSKSEPRYWQNGTVPWVSPKDMKAQRISGSQDHITKEALQQSAARLVPSTSILVVTRSGILEHTLPAAITTLPVAINQDLKALIPRENVLAEFVLYGLKWAEKSILHTCSKAGTTVANISFGQFVDFRIPLPPLAEQRRIVEVIEEQFSRLDSAESTLAKNLSMVKALRASCFSAITRIFAAPDLEIAEPKLPLPAGWYWMRATDVCRSIDSGSTPKADRMHPGCGDVPFLKVYNITMDGRINFMLKPTFVDSATHENQLARSKVRPGDVLMNIVGPPLGKVAIVPDTHPEWNINQAIVAFRPKPSLNSRFLANCLMSDAILRPLLHTGKATAGQTNLSLSNSRRLWLPIPPEREQEKIAEEIERQVSVYSSVANSLADATGRSQRLRRAILETAFGGRLVRREAGADAGFR